VTDKVVIDTGLELRKKGVSNNEIAQSIKDVIMNGDRQTPRKRDKLETILPQLTIISFRTIHK